MNSAGSYSVVLIQDEENILTGLIENCLKGDREWYGCVEIDRGRRCRFVRTDDMDILVRMMLLVPFRSCGGGWYECDVINLLVWKSVLDRGGILLRRML